MFFDDLFDDYDPFDAYSYRQQRPQTASLFKNDNRSIILRKLYNDEWVSSPKRHNNSNCVCVYQKSFKIQEAKRTEMKGNKQINP